MKGNTFLKSVFAVCMIYSAVFFSGSGEALAAQDPFLLLPDCKSASSSDNAMSPILNPVFAATPGSPMLAYRYLQFNGEEKADHLLAMRLMGFSFTYGWFDNIYSDSAKKKRRFRHELLQYQQGILLR